MARRISSWAVWDCTRAALVSRHRLPKAAARALLYAQASRDADLRGARFKIVREFAGMIAHYDSDASTTYCLSCLTGINARKA